MISRDPPFHYDISCDICSAGEARVEAEHFLDAIQAIKDLGWQVRKSYAGFDHVCPDCVEAER